MNTDLNEKLSNIKEIIIPQKKKFAFYSIKDE